MIKGLDISIAQGVVPFDKLSDEYSFVIAKSVQGNDGVDPNFFKNVETARNVGLTVGAYFFVYPLSHIDPVAQAQMFYDKSKGFGSNVGDLPPFLDIEWPEITDWTKWKCTPKQVSAWLKALCEAMTEKFSCRPIIYTYLSWWQYLATNADVSWAKDYKLWMAWYVRGWPADTDVPKVPAPWSPEDAIFWQFDGNGGLKLPNGVDADFCVFNGTKAELDALANGPRARYEGDV